MKVKYQFVNEAVDVEVPEELGKTILEFDRQEHNNNQTERRRHVSLNGMDYEGDLFKDDSDVESGILKDQEITSIRLAISRLTPDQQFMLHAIFFEGISVSEYAASVGVDHSAISHRLRTIYKKLKSSL